MADHGEVFWGLPPDEIKRNPVTIIDVRSKPVGKPGRPLIGLVLGSGAARGFAHIGVIHALLEHGIIPDIVVGTSMGALIGGCYVNGQLDQLEAWARALTLRRILGYLDVRIGGSGLIGGGRLARRLEQAIGTRSIEDLPVRFAAITVEFAPDGFGRRQTQAVMM